MILHITGVDVCGPHRLRLAFDNGIRKTVDVFPLLSGPVFEPLRDPIYFSQAALDPVCGTVVWPNGADFAPEALYALAPADEDAAAFAATKAATAAGARHVP